ncbi:DUF4177 domain-containing protein [Runella zeae]|uniref:DUF4177 domain-containing protein n=1 Tax=Runella zeae TaxID=94255 RepID=UPI00040A9DFD|nr:DUF4177 domain-containing protein [Runella zeae]
MTKFEYKVIELKPGGFWGMKLDAADIEVQLNKMAQEGWELVNSLDMNVGHGATSKMFFIFKRLATF